MPHATPRHPHSELPDDGSAANPLPEAESLLRLFLKDREQRAKRPAYTAATCFLCNRPYSPQPLAGDDSTRFCGPRCREAYDAGAIPARDLDPFTVPPDQWRVLAGPPPGYMPRTPMRMGRVGFFVDCLHCKREFESKGLRCCSTECEQACTGRAKAKVTVAEVGDILVEKRKCECCGGDIPNWTGEGANRKRTRKSQRYCSDQCRWRTNKTGHFFAPSRGKPAPELPEPIPPIFGPSTPPLNLVGGYPWPDAPEIELHASEPGAAQPQQAAMFPQHRG